MSKSRVNKELRKTNIWAGRFPVWSRAGARAVWGLRGAAGLRQTPPPAAWAAHCALALPRTPLPRAHGFLAPEARGGGGEHGGLNPDRSDPGWSWRG